MPIFGDDKPKHLETWSPLADRTILSEVDVIVPFHGQYEHVGRLIETLWESTRGIFYNICLVDDGSPNRSFMDKIESMKVPSMKFARHAERRGFGAAINSGIAATSSPWVVIANSDVSFEQGGWLRAMGETYRRLSPGGVKMVSAKLDNSPPGDPRVVGVKIEDVSDSILEPTCRADIAGKDMYLPFVCVLAHRDLFSKLGPVREYPLGWYEDVEFACRMHARGYRQAVCGRAAVRHVGGATIDALCREDGRNRRVLESNYDRCLRDIAPQNAPRPHT